MVVVVVAALVVLVLVVLVRILDYGGGGGGGACVRMCVCMCMIGKAPSTCSSWREAKHRIPSTPVDEGRIHAGLASPNLESSKPASRAGFDTNQPRAGFDANQPRVGFDANQPSWWGGMRPIWVGAFGWSYGWHRHMVGHMVGHMGGHMVVIWSVIWSVIWVVIWVVILVAWVDGPEASQGLRTRGGGARCVGGFGTVGSVAMRGGASRTASASISGVPISSVSIWRLTGCHLL